MKDEHSTDKDKWRNHPQLKGKFHPDYPDDLQVIVHDGGPRVSQHRPEIVWVTVTACNQDVFEGKVLNQPHQLKNIRMGDIISFIVAPGIPHPLFVTRQYLDERASWVIDACNQCGSTELFDPPSTLMKVVFPNVPSNLTLSIFTAICGNCGGIQTVRQAETGTPKP